MIAILRQWGLYWLFVDCGWLFSPLHSWKPRAQDPPRKGDGWSVCPHRDTLKGRVRLLVSGRVISRVLAAHRLAGTTGHGRPAASWSGQLDHGWCCAMREDGSAVPRLTWLSLGALSNHAPVKLLATSGEILVQLWVHLDHISTYRGAETCCLTVNIVNCQIQWLICGQIPWSTGIDLLMLPFDHRIHHAWFSAIINDNYGTSCIIYILLPRKINHKWFMDPLSITYLICIPQEFNNYSHYGMSWISHIT